MKTKKKILIFCDRNSHRAPRLFNEVDALKEDYEIVLAGDQQPPIVDSNQFIDVSQETLFKSFHKVKSNSIVEKIDNQIKKFRVLFLSIFLGNFKGLRSLYNFRFFLIYNRLKKEKFDILLCHHISSLPICYLLAKRQNAKLVVNLHEYYPKEFNDQKNWKKIEAYWEKICFNFLSKSDLNLCVNRSITEEYVKNFELDENKFLDYINSKPFIELAPSKVNSKELKLIHHGAAIPSRQLDKMIDMMNYLPDNYTLTFMLVPSNPKFYEELRQKESERIRFEAVVPVNEIPKKINEFDIGVYLLSPSNLNEELALPNKFFEFIQGRLCLAIGPSKEMSRLVQDNGIGVVSNDYNPQNLALAINKLTVERISEMKLKSNKLSKKLNAEKGAEELRNRFNRLYAQ